MPLLCSQEQKFTRVSLAQFRSSQFSMEEQCLRLRRSLNLPDTDAIETGKRLQAHTFTSCARAVAQQRPMGGLDHVRLVWADEAESTSRQTWALFGPSCLAGVLGAGEERQHLAKAPNFGGKCSSPSWSLGRCWVLHSCQSLGTRARIGSGQQGYLNGWERSSLECLGRLVGVLTHQLTSRDVDECFIHACPSQGPRACIKALSA